MAMFETYVVRKGDTLSDIATRYGTTVQALMSLNSIAKGDSMDVNRVLNVRQVSDTYYVVQSGDTLSKIAQRFKVTANQIATANKLPNANKISPGQQLIIPTPGPTITASSISPAATLGSLSKKYEVGKRGPGTVSTGKGDKGGVSYGSYQLASKSGNARKFLSKEGQRWEAEFGETVEGLPEFSRIWERIAAREPDLFHQAQHDYIQRTHYDPQVATIEALSGIDVSTRSRALMDVVWSTAVQHGGRSKLIGDVLKKLALDPSSALFDREAIKAIYGERGRTNAAGVLVHFSGNSAEVQQGVAGRFRNELNDALAMLDAQATLAKVTPPVPESSSGNKGANAAADGLLRKAQKSLTDDEVHTLIEKYGDQEARTEFLNGKKVLIALRNPTSSKQYLKGKFDDPIIVVWREAGGAIGLKRFMGNTEPARIYAWGHARQAKGPSQDFDGDRRNDLGRLMPGTYHYQPRKEGNYCGNKAFRARNIQAAMRDVNQDGEFSILTGDKIDEKGAGRSMLLHQGGTGDDTWSAGCQTISKTTYNSFLATLGPQTSFSYILINVE